MLSPTMALLCRAVVPVFIQAFRNHGNMEKLTLYKPCLSELLCFSPSFLLVSAALQLFCRFLNACWISSSIRRERNVAPYPPNRSISAGEIRQAPSFDVLPQASSVVCSGLGGPTKPLWRETETHGSKQLQHSTWAARFQADSEFVPILPLCLTWSDTG